MRRTDIEFKEEILQRSRQRIRKRTRNITLAGCTALIVCMAICFAVIRSSMHENGAPSDSQSGGGINSGTNGGLVLDGSTPRPQTPTPERQDPTPTQDLPEVTPDITPEPTPGVTPTVTPPAYNTPPAYTVNTTYEAINLMRGITPRWPGNVSPNKNFTDAVMNFSVEFFKASVSKNGANKNIFISPLSMQLALAMTVNGARSDTADEMRVLLTGDMSLESFNKYFKSYMEALTSGGSSELETANSIWLKDDGESFQPNGDFLQMNADYYGADIFKAPFDEQTLNDINKWTSAHTNGKIDKAIDKIDFRTIMYIINVLTFNAKWQDPYRERFIVNGTFTTESGAVSDVNMMHSNESMYLDDGMAKGFIKYYEGGRYAFAALLPNKNVSMSKYVESLTADKLAATLANAQNTAVETEMPEFKYDFSASMSDVLKSLGMKTAFDYEKADFSGIGTTSLGNGRLYIGNVLQKTYISVGGLGTEAGSVTIVDVDAPTSEEPPSIAVILNRPFVYMIFDTETNLPIFMGIANTI